MDCEQFSEVDDLLAMVQFGDQKCLHFSQKLHELEIGLGKRRNQINFVMLMQQLHFLRASMDSTRLALQQWECKARAYLQQLHQLVCGRSGLSQEQTIVDHRDVEQKITSLLRIIKTQHHGLLDKQKRSERLYIVIVEKKQQLEQLS